MTVMAKVTRDKKIEVNPRVLHQDLGGEAVLLNLDTSIYFSLDEVGARIWALLTEGRNLSEIVTAITAEYAVSAAECEADLLDLIVELERAALVTV